MNRSCPTIPRFSSLDKRWREEWTDCDRMRKGNDPIYTPWPWCKSNSCLYLYVLVPLRCYLHFKIAYVEYMIKYLCTVTVVMVLVPPGYVLSCTILDSNVQYRCLQYRCQYWQCTCMRVIHVHVHVGNRTYKFWCSKLLSFVIGTLVSWRGRRVSGYRRQCSTTRR